MRDDILNEVLKAIQADYGLEGKGDWLQKGKCPQCGRKELFTRASSPYVLRCGRANRCGWESSVKDLYPEIFDVWSKRHQATEDDPTAAADAYLGHARGLNLMGLRGCYSQENFVERERGISSATVRFPLPGGGWWERLIDQPGRFEKKANFAWGKSYAGHWWAAPDHDIEKLVGADRLWIVEGIFDALSLRQAGQVAVSAMSCNNWPGKALADLRKACAAAEKPLPELIFAFDVGKAGVEYTRKFVRKARDEGWRATAAQAKPDGEGEKLDWNDLLLRDRLTAADLDEYLWNGQVMVAGSATEKAVLIYLRRKWSSFSFVHDSVTWWANFNEARIAEVKLADGLSDRGAAEACAQVDEIANCAFRILYFQRDDATDESQYYLRVDTPDDRPARKAAFSPSSISAAADFKKRLLAVSPGAQFLGSTTQLDRLIKAQGKRIKTVETLDYTGFSKEHGAWVLGDIAVKDGRVVRLNDEDYFDFGKLSLKLGTRERILSIDYDPDDLPTSWIEDLWVAYRTNGMVALAFWFQTLFAEQVRAAYGKMPFLEMSGDPGSGKTTLLEFLWKLVGRADYEGFDPQKATNAAIARNLSKVGNLPIVLIEGDRDTENGGAHNRRFEWEELKTAYNGRSPRSRGVKNSGNETYEPPMRGSIIISQNDPVNASPAVLERIMQLHFDKAHFNTAGKAAAERMKARRASDLSGFIVHAIRREAKVMSAFKTAFKRHEAEMIRRGEVMNDRLIENHCQLLAALEALHEWLRLPEEVFEETVDAIYRMAVRRREALSREHPVVARFWEIFDYLESLDPATPINRHRKPEQFIAVNLPDFERRCREKGQSPPSADKLMAHLRTSRTRRFNELKVVNGIDDKYLKCWVFQTEQSNDGRNAR